MTHDQLRIQSSKFIDVAKLTRLVGLWLAAGCFRHISVQKLDKFRGGLEKIHPTRNNLKPLICLKKKGAQELKRGFPNKYGVELSFCPYPRSIYFSNSFQTFPNKEM